MNIYSVCAFGVCAVFIGVVLRQFKTEFQPLFTAAAGIMITGYVLLQITPALEFITRLASRSGISEYITVMVKALGIALICQFASEICRDCGEASIGSKIELAGKVGILLISLPVIEKLLDTAKDLL